ncbi:flavodoxin [Paenibacillus sp. LMG 31459]|uniref:Flavodoxin n=1 Tax=Paenibacillus phytohabitans TaxID=2654978 RepID=A0ABX1YCF5_9BACL|nr:flavodoxin [Paenibacillus phytohabitans]NOU77494.1 flavodoxin [Paenibacillus phytohabitans]
MKLSHKKFPYSIGGTILLSSALLLSLSACGTAGRQAAAQPPADAGQNEIDSDTASEDSASAEGKLAIKIIGKSLITYFAVAENSNVDAVSSASVLPDTGLGLVRTIADDIQSVTGSELFSIQTTVDYPGDIDDLLDYAEDEQDDNARPELTDHIADLADYDNIFIGFPTWWYDLPQVMYSFFDEYDFSGKTIIPFNVHNGSRFSGTIKTIQKLEPEANVITDGFTVHQSDVGAAGGEVTDWLRGLEL